MHTLEDIHDMWDEDTNIDPTDLAEEARKIPKLHAKYYRMLTSEHQIQRRLEADLKKLLLLRSEFYDGTLPEEELRKYGWEPYLKRVLKSDIKNYLDSDPLVIKIKLKIGEQHEKVDLLEGILKSLNNRGFLLNTMLQFEKLKLGLS